MDDGLKQRLVGAIVIVAVAIIFIPMIFNQEGQRPEDIQITLPPPPEAPKAQLEKPQRPQAEDTQQRAAEENEKVSSPMPQGWVLQVASFKDRDNADALRDRLRSAGYDVYVAYHPEKSEGMARVYVGPELERSALLPLQQQIKEAFALQGFIVKYLAE